jgi:hypothetical protein
MINPELENCNKNHSMTVLAEIDTESKDSAKTVYVIEKTDDYVLLSPTGKHLYPWPARWHKGYKSWNMCDHTQFDSPKEAETEIENIICDEIMSKLASLGQ